MKHACLSTTAGGEELGISPPGQVHVCGRELVLSRVLLLGQLSAGHCRVHGCKEICLCLGVPCLHASHTSLLDMRAQLHWCQQERQVALHCCRAEDMHGRYAVQAAVRHRFRAEVCWGRHQVASAGEDRPHS